MKSFDILHFSFMQHAFIAGLLAGITCSIIGVFVVIMRLSSIGICITHAAFAGGIFAILINGSRIGWALGFSLLTAALIGPIADRGELSPDTSTGVIFSAMLGLSFLFLGFMPGARTEALNLFWGSILTVTPRDLWFLGAVALLVLIGLTAFFKEIQAVLCHKETALAVGIPATAIFYGMLFLTGAVITASLRSVGGLLIYSLIINPAAAAYQMTYNLKKVFALAALFGVQIQTADEKALTSVSGDVRLATSANTIRVAPLKIKLDDSNIDGELTVGTGRSSAIRTL
jgi:manganese/iron transport system permease protein